MPTRGTRASKSATNAIVMAAFHARLFGSMKSGSQWTFTQRAILRKTGIPTSAKAMSTVQRHPRLLRSAVWIAMTTAIQAASAQSKPETAFAAVMLIAEA
jgi:hypothetical protein